MKLYVATKIYTPNELGGTGSIADVILCSSLDDAYKQVYDDMHSHLEKIETIEKVNIEDGQGKIVAECNYVTDWDSDVVEWEIREFDTDKIFNKPQEL